jgi:hypothetical protein
MDTSVYYTLLLGSWRGIYLSVGQRIFSFVAEGQAIAHKNLNVQTIEETCDYLQCTCVITEGLNGTRVPAAMHSSLYLPCFNGSLSK